ncbi:MAG TPA: zinc ribbon domain-containing protein [Steroidobacteraceae bacterium]|jgi:hypothetical protein|nr:zinc ribbon domain-containing protein [Steroidobacteraceae bacterium]
MPLIQFTRNFNDHSTDRGYQFEFFCDRCRNGFTSPFVASKTGMAASMLRAAGGMFGNVLGSAASTANELQRAVQGTAHDKAYRDSVEEARPNFSQCPKCTHWVCKTVCWNQKRSLCFACAPDVDTELAAAQSQETVDQMRAKLHQEDMTKNVQLTSEAIASCPDCGAHTQGAKFCPSCGKSLRGKNECAKCGTKFDLGSKFCPECGGKAG